MKYSILFAIGLALALPIQAAQKAGAHAKAKITQEQIFNKKDKNHDGFLSKHEFIGKSKHAAKKAKIFAKKDTNHDGKLSLQEFIGKVKPQSKVKRHGKGKRHVAPTAPATQN